MSPRFNIQTEVRVADILALLETGETRYFICDNVAYLIRDKLALMPGYEEFQKLPQFRNEDRYMMPYFFATLNERVGFRCGPIEFDLSYQVVKQLNSLHCRITDEYPYPCDEVLNDGLLNVHCPRGDSPYFHWSRIARIQFLRAIVKFDPQAVLSINI